MLRDLMRRHEVDCWLVNTGWNGGPHGTGERISLRHTRAMLHAALAGELAQASYQEHPAFGLVIPTACPDVPSEILDPKATWADGDAYDRAAHEVAKRFEDNFERFAAHVGDDVKAAGIHASA
jgi:phosphoenolpyruvate carboxykinase (ATP)